MNHVLYRKGPSVDRSRKRTTYRIVRGHRSIGIANEPHYIVKNNRLIGLHINYALLHKGPSVLRSHTNNALTYKGQLFDQPPGRSVNQSLKWCA